MGGETPKKVVVSWTAVKNAGSRATRASAKLERRVVPVGHQAVSCRCSAYREAAVTAVQMPLTPGYGETPLPHDELAALLPEVVEVLDKPITRADVYDLEQGLQDQVFDLLMPTAVEGSLSLDELLSDHFVRDLHARMFGPV